MTKLTKAAAKKLAEQKVHPGYIALTLQYEEKVIVPYAAGIMLIQTLEQAELIDGYSDVTKKISPIGNKLQFEIISRADYIEYKMRALMNIGETDA